MAYTKTTWTSGSTPCSAANMNNLETQYEKAMADILNNIVHSAGDNLWAYSDMEQGTSEASYTKIRGLRIGIGGTLRIKFDMHCDGTHTAYGKIYKNGNPVGTQHSTTSSSYQTYSEDIAGWKSGDEVQLYIHCDGAYSVIRNFRIYIASTNPFGMWITV